MLNRVFRVFARVSSFSAGAALLPFVVSLDLHVTSTTIFPLTLLEWSLRNASATPSLVSGSVASIAGATLVLPPDAEASPSQTRANSARSDAHPGNRIQNSSRPRANRFTPVTRLIAARTHPTGRDPMVT